MATYEKLFSRHGLHVGQVLLTHADLEDHARHLNARHTLLMLLRQGVVPIINENDTVSVTELKFGDNDKLSALVSALLPADLLVILTTVEGVIENFGREEARVLSVVDAIDGTLEKMAGGTASATAVGGMKAKIEAAKIVVRAGIPLVIASGRHETVLRRILQGEDEGTLFVPHAQRLKGRKRGLLSFTIPAGLCESMKERNAPCAKAVKVCCPREFTIAKASLTRAKWSESVICMATNSPGASPASRPSRYVPGNWPVPKWFIAMIWSFCHKHQSVEPREGNCNDLHPLPLSVNRSIPSV
jgi:hypothetical protein